MTRCSSLISRRHPRKHAVGATMSMAAVVPDLMSARPDATVAESCERTIALRDGRVVQDVRR